MSPADLMAVLQQHWRINPTGMRQERAGSGGYHWSVPDASGHEWFVTANDLHNMPWLVADADPDAVFDQLRAAMDTAVELAALGLEFVAAPVRTRAGQALVRCTPRHAVAVFPFLPGAAGQFADGRDSAERAAVTDMLAQLHAATVPSAPARGPRIPSGPALHAALADLDRAWTGGPFGEQARGMLAGHADVIRRAWIDFDALTARVVTEQRPLVLTHGEPHPANTLRSGARRWLVDWDTVGMAWPERDLWMVAGPDGTETARYQAITGTRVSQAGIQMYRCRWLLEDLAIFTCQLKADHDRTPDTELAIASLTSTIDQLAGPGRQPGERSGS